MIGESLIKELFIGCQQGQGKPLRNDKAPQGQKLLEVVKILRPRGVMGGIAPAIRENSGCGRGTPDKSQGLGQRDALLSNDGLVGKKWEDEYPNLSLILTSLTSLLCLIPIGFPLLEPTEKPDDKRAQFIQYTKISLQAPRRTNRGHPSLSHSQSSPDLI